MQTKTEKTEKIKKKGRISGFFKKIPKWLKITGCIVIAFALVFAGLTIYSRNAQAKNRTEPDLTTLSKGDLIQSVSVSGVVQSDTVNNIYSTQTYPVMEIYFDVGDTVKKGDILAVLDSSKLENDIAQSEINLQSAINTAEQEVTNNGNSVVNAETSIESAQISVERQQISASKAQADLADVQKDKTEGFDAYTYENTINDAATTLERKTKDLNDAQDDYDEAVISFDDYTYQNTIKEALITLQRKQADLVTAQDDLAEAKRGEDYDFDDYSYQSAIDQAESAVSSARRDLNDAKSDLDTANYNYNTLIYSSDATDAEKSAALTKVETARSTVTAKEKALDSAYTSLDKAENDLDHARDNYEDSLDDANEAAVEAAEKSLETAQKAADDAQRTYNKAVEDRGRAQNDAIDAAETKLTNAQNSLADAQTAYDKAISDYERAADDFNEDTQTQIDNAKRTLSDSQKQLESSQNSLKSAENTLDQTANKTLSQTYSVELQELSLEKLKTNLEECVIVATGDGVITEKNLKVGSTPSGILFVIEDFEDLYVSANVKEYNLSSIALDQTAVVTSDATGDSVYEATVTYISPKAVSAAGSTSVEFEIRAALKQPDNYIKIGMNAYLNVITDTHENVYTVTLSTVSSESGQSYVYSYENGEAVKIPVTVGLKNSTLVEISGDGLYEGMSLLADPKSYYGEYAESSSITFTGIDGASRTVG